MGRRPSLKKDQCAHVTLRCQNKKHLLNPHKHWPAISSWLNCLPHYFEIDLHHFVVMSNHFHFLLTPREENFGRGMSYFATNLSKYLNHSQDTINHVFGNRYQATWIESERHLINVIRYIYQNPVRAGIVKNATDYKFSSLGVYTGQFNPQVKITADVFTKELFSFGASGWEIWNRSVGSALSDADIKQIQDCFTRFQFRFTRRQIRKVNHLGSSLQM